jgi:conjugative transfer region protein TrbK
MMGARSLRAATAVVLIAFLVAALALSSRRPSPRPDVTDTPAAPVQDLSAELRRCDALGSQQANDLTEDAHCRAVWEENRRHFFGHAARSGATSAPRTDTGARP